MSYDLVDLKLVAAISECGSLSRAAVSLGLAPSSVSCRLAKLESSLRVTLFARHVRWLMPTAAGHAVVRHARQLLGHLGELEADMLFHSGDPGRQVRLLANSCAVNCFLPNELAGFQQIYPEARVRLAEAHSTEVIGAVMTGQAEIGVVSMNAFPEEVAVLPYRENSLVLLLPAGHRMSAVTRIHVRDVLNEPFVGLHPGDGIHPSLVELAASHHVKLDVRVQVQSFDAACGMVAAGLGIAVVPQGFIRFATYSFPSSVVAVPIADSWAERNLQLCFQRGRELAPVAAALLRHLNQRGAAKRPIG